MSALPQGQCHRRVPRLTPPPTCAMRSLRARGGDSVRWGAHGLVQARHTVRAGHTLALRVRNSRAAGKGSVAGIEWVLSVRLRKRLTFRDGLHACSPGYTPWSPRCPHACSGTVILTVDILSRQHKDRL